jgi:sucrose-6-phosphate hydrolase SacC (GH32 family)
MMIGGPERKVRLWKSTNLLDWEVLFDIPNKAAECIDMYEVAVDGDPNNKKWVISNAGTGYEVGEFDGKSWRGYGTEDQNGRPLKFDYGDSYYAAQTFNQAPGGRVVHVGWLHSKKFYRPFLDAGMPFTQQMSIPAEITLRTTPDGIRMFRNPVKEIETLYIKTDRVEGATLKQANAQLAALEPELIDMTLRLAPKADITLHVRGLPIKYNLAQQQFEFVSTQRAAAQLAAIEAKHPKAPRKPKPGEIMGLEQIPVPLQNGQVSLRVLVDRASLELFAGDGQAAASFVIVPSAADRSIRLEGAEEQEIQSIVVNELKSIWER